MFNPKDGANELDQYYHDGFGTFDMADHYGSAELITGRLLARCQDEQQRQIACTKWCPVPGPMTKGVIGKGVQERLDRLGIQQLDLLQFAGRLSSTLLGWMLYTNSHNYVKRYSSKR